MKPRKNQARPLADYVSEFLDPSIERRLGMNIDLLSAWDELVGDEFRGVSRPEKLVWGSGDSFEPATLVISCESSHSIFLQHEVHRLLERINVYFGFTAVDKIRVVQKEIGTEESPDDSPPELSYSDELRLRRVLEGINDPDRRALIEKWGRSIFGSSSD